MKATTKEGKLIIEIDLQEPSPSKSGKSLVVATTSGFMATTAQVDGKPVKISLNAIIGR